MCLLKLNLSHNNLGLYLQLEAADWEKDTR